MRLERLKYLNMNLYLYSCIIIRRFLRQLFTKLEDYPQELIQQHFVYEENPEEFSLEYYQKLFEETKAKGNDEDI